MGSLGVDAGHAAVSIWLRLSSWQDQAAERSQASVMGDTWSRGGRCGQAPSWAAGRMVSWSRRRQPPSESQPCCALQSEVSCVEPQVASGTRPCGGSMENWHQQRQTSGAECPGDGASWAHAQPIRFKCIPGVCRSELRWSQCPGGGAGVEMVRGRRSPGELTGTRFTLSPGRALRA